MCERELVLKSSCFVLGLDDQHCVQVAQSFFAVTMFWFGKGPVLSL